MEATGLHLRLFASVFFAAMLLAGEMALASSIHPESRNLYKPHFLYMKKLRDYISSANVVLPHSKDVSDDVDGKLVATSIETKSSSGTGYSEMGFLLEGMNRLELEFTIPKLSNGRDFPDVELWIFPDKSREEPNRGKEIMFRTQILIAGTSNPRIQYGKKQWDTNEDCIAINLTFLSKRIYRNLQKKKQNETDVTLIFELISTNYITLQNDSINSLHRNFCSALSHRNTNDAFLIIKNYDKNTTNMMKNSIEIQNVLPDPVHNVNEFNQASQNNCCNRSSLVVNLAEIYGSFVKGPIDINIWDCTGECTATYSGNLFTHHATVKERLKLLPEGQALSDFQPHCTPVMFKPFHVIFSVHEKSDVIVQLLDLVVEKCGCR